MIVYNYVFFDYKMGEKSDNDWLSTDDIWSLL